MGTRGSSGYIIKDQEYLGYNHFDSYPAGLGHTILQFISDINKKDDWEEFKERAGKVIQLNGGDIIDIEIQKKYKKYSNLSVSKQTLEDPYCLFRKIQHDWIKEIYNGELQHFLFNNNFIKDSLFCEYAYIINLDTMMLEYYSGFQQKLQHGNRFGITLNKNLYYPCRLVGIFNLKNIIDKNDIKKIIEKMEKIYHSKKDDSSVIAHFRKIKLENVANSK